MIKEWYKDWFSSNYYLEVYKHRNFEDTENLVELILSNTDIKPDAKILDAACGAGRYSIKFAERGFDVTGFDLSKSMLEIAENEASIRNLKIDFQHYDNAFLRLNFACHPHQIKLGLARLANYLQCDERQPLPKPTPLPVGRTRHKHRILLPEKQFLGAAV